MRSLVAVVLVLGCGSKPDLADPGGGPPDASVAHLTITPDSATIAAGAQQTFTVSNDGGSDTTSAILLEIGGTDSTSFAISMPDCTVLGPNQSCTVDVANNGFIPNAVGELRATAAGAHTATAELQGTGMISGNLKIVQTVATAMYAYEPLGGVSPAVSYTITNTSSTQSGPLVLTVPDPFRIGGQTDHCTGANLTPNAPGNTCTFGLQFAPMSGMPGTRNGVLVATGAPSSITGQTQITAQLIPPFTIQPTGSTHDFGSVSMCPGQLRPTQTFTILNTTSQTWTSDSVIVTSQDATSFPILQNGCTSPAAAGQSCQVTVGVEPTPLTGNSQAGPRSSVLQVTVMAFGFTAMQSVNLIANTTACPTTLSITPQDLNFNATAGQTDTIAVTVHTTAPTGPLTVVATTPFMQNNDCSPGLASASATCTITLSYFSSVPTGSTGVAGMLTVSGTPGGTLVTPMTGHAQ